MAITLNQLYRQLGFLGVVALVILVFPKPVFALDLMRIFSKKPLPVVTVASPPFIEMRTGPGRGYPIFYIVERGDHVEVIRRKTEWFKVRNVKGKEGWVSRDNMARSLLAAGNAIAMQQFGLEDFENRKWEMGVQGGSFDGAPLISGLLAYSYTKNLSIEFNITESNDNLQNSVFATVNLLNQPYPEWRYSPFFLLGTGKVQTKLNQTLVQSDDLDNELVQVGIGLRTYITRQFVFRVEYRNYMVLTNQDENREIEEWKAGFGVFF